MADSSNGASQQDHFPLAAQIPLSSFTLPTFPDAASHLRALTLTCDIDLNEYQSKHLQPGTFEPSTTLPPSITHLTLELFSLGFPAPFLTELIKLLPNLQSLTLFSCLIDGLDDKSRKDAIAFFKAASQGLRELHVVDTFSRTGFWKEISGQFKASATSDNEGGLKVLEVSYTYRGHYESDFLNRTGGEEWAHMIDSSLVGLSLNFSSPPKDLEDMSMKAEKSEDQEELATQDGILPYASDGRASQAIQKSFASLKETNVSSELKVLNLTMFTMRAEDVADIASCCADESKHIGLVGLSASILLEDMWMQKLTDSLRKTKAGSELESIEVSGVPSTASKDIAKRTATVEELLDMNTDQIASLAVACPKLDRFEISMLKSRRLGSIVWVKKEEKWELSRVSEDGPVMEQ